MRATSADASLRDGREGVRLAERARGLVHDADADALDILAAAYAEVGRFADAVRMARQALEVAGDEAELAGDPTAPRTVRSGWPVRDPVTRWFGDFRVSRARTP